MCVRVLCCLQCYAVDEESEVKMLEQAAHYHRAQQQSPATAVPLLALFCGKVLLIFYYTLVSVFFADVIALYHLMRKMSSVLFSLIQWHTSWYHTTLMEVSGPFRNPPHCPLV